MGKRRTSGLNLSCRKKRGEIFTYRHIYSYLEIRKTTEQGFHIKIINRVKPDGNLLTPEKYICLNLTLNKILSDPNISLKSFFHINLKILIIK